MIIQSNQGVLLSEGKTRSSSCASLPVHWLLLLLQHVRLIYVSPFCFPATPGPFDSPKGKACQKNIYATFVAALDLKVSPPSPSPPLFLSSIHPCFHSSVVSHQTYLQELGVSFSVFYFIFFPPVPGFSWICSSLHNSAVSELIRETV